MATNPDRVRVRNLIVYRPIIYGNTATLLTPEERKTAPADHTHRWTVAIRSPASAPNSDIVGGVGELGHIIKRVTFKLHDTYPNPNRSVDKEPFEVSETGWGEFEIQIRVNFVAESGEKALVLYHHLKLHPWPAVGEPEIPTPEVALKAGPVHSWQYDEILFFDPFQSLLTTMENHPPTPLPKEARKPVPFSTAYPASLEASRGGVPEFTAAMISEEKERLDVARKSAIAEAEKWREILIEREKERDRLERSVKAQEMS